MELKSLMYFTYQTSHSYKLSTAYFSLAFSLHNVGFKSTRTLRPRKAAKTAGEETQERDMDDATDAIAEFDKEIDDFVFDPTRDNDFDLRGLSLQGAMHGYSSQRWKY